MGEHGLLAAHRAGRAEAKAHDGTIVTDNVNEMWGTDMTQTITIGEGRAYVLVAVEHANSEVVGIHAARSANRFEALEPVRQGVRGCFGAIAPGVARGLKLRHDHGSNYMAGDFQDEIKCLGIEASPSFVREPEGNGVAERFIRTLKENLLWVKTFEMIDQSLILGRLNKRSRMSRNRAAVQSESDGITDNCMALQITTDVPFVVELEEQFWAGRRRPLSLCPLDYCFRMWSPRSTHVWHPEERCPMRCLREASLAKVVLNPGNVIVSEFDTNETIGDKIIKPNGGGGM